MSQVRPFILAVCLLFLSATHPQAAHPQDQPRQTESTPATPQKVTVTAVFNADEKFVDAAKSACQDLDSDKLQDCFAAQMKKAKASPAAAEFSQQLGEPGFLRDYKVAGPVDIAYVLYPYRANENQSCLIVNGQPAVIDVDNHKIVGAGALQYNSTYQALSRAHKDLSLWPSDRYSIEVPDIEMGPGAGPRIVVNYRLREKCHACAVLGHAWYSFDFDSKGKFQGARFMAVTTTHDKTAPLRDARKPIATAAGEEFTIALPVKAAGPAEWTLARGLDTQKVRLIEHTHVAPPSATGAAGREELWKFAALGPGATIIEFSKSRETAKTQKFHVIIHGRTTSAPMAEPTLKKPTE